MADRFLAVAGVVLFALGATMTVFGTGQTASYQTSYSLTTYTQTLSTFMPCLCSNVSPYCQCPSDTWTSAYSTSVPVSKLVDSPDYVVNIVGAAIAISGLALLASSLRPRATRGVAPSIP